MSSNSPSNKTQCPHCLTIYQITAAQLTQSKGNVRCGSCHERFKAQLMSDDEIKEARRKVTPTNDLFAKSEPPAAPPAQTLDNKHANTPAVTARDEQPSEPPSPTAQASRAVQSTRQSIDDLALEQRTAKRTSTPRAEPDNAVERRAPMFDFQIADSELSLPQSDPRDSRQAADPLLDRQRVNEDIDFVFGQSREKAAINAATRRTDPVVAEPGDKDLINEIDRIIEDRFTSDAALKHAANNARAPTTTPKREPVRPIDWHKEIALDADLTESPSDRVDDSDISWGEEDDLFIEPSAQRTRGRSLLGASLGLLVVGIVLSALVFGLAYQVWFKQFTFVQGNDALQSTLSSVMLPSIEQLAEIGLVLPKPTNLSGITLISAQAEPHPNRATTTLMRVSFLNRSSAEQQLPWVELTLTDEAGKVVARRALKPEDYLFNNATQTRIGPHELKKITIELLAFPKVATGFELKMLQSLDS